MSVATARRHVVIATARRRDHPWALVGAAPREDPPLLHNILSFFFGALTLALACARLRLRLRFRLRFRFRFRFRLRFRLRSLALACAFAAFFVGIGAATATVKERTCGESPPPAGIET